jgi:poly-gamma-glutamate synthesis protein (capsule biosynthesis protein)
MKNKFIYSFFILVIVFIVFSVNLFKENINGNKIYNYINAERNNPVTSDGKQEIKLLFVGDIMMTRYVEKRIKKLNKEYIYPFEKILNYLKSFDYVIANLEGPISDKGVKVGSKYSFRMKPEVAEALSKANINIVNLANNHIFDYGKVAFEDTLKNLEKNNIKYFGNSYEPLIIEKEGVKIGFLGFSDFLKHLEVKENKTGIATINDNISEIIKKAKEKVDILIVSFHWGEEYKKIANERQRKIAKIAIDSGADLVIGHHPHVIQDIEKYKDKFIFYSLGNFIFDQNFSKETMIGGGVEVYIKTQTKQTERRLGRITKTQTNADYMQTNADLIPIIQNIYFRKFYLNNNFQIENMSEKLVPYELDKKIYLLREAKTSEEWQKGLMFIKKPVDYDGMIFIFPDKQIRSFWNKNTFVDLEVYWLDDNKIIGKEELPSIIKTKTVKIITSPLPVNKVVEIIK